MRLLIRPVAVGAFTAALVTLPVTFAADAKRRGAARPKAPATKRLARAAQSQLKSAEICARTFVTGEQIGNGQISATGPHSLTIKNDTKVPALIKVSDATDLTLTRFYVERAQQWTLTGIPDGDYVIRFVSDPVLSVNCDDVLNAAQSQKFPGPKPLRVTTDANGNSYSVVLEYTLYTVPGGNVSPTRISLIEFNRN